MSEEENLVRERVIDGQASREEAERFISELERQLESALAQAASANDRLARDKQAAADLIRTLPAIAGEDERLTRLTLAQEAIDRHEAAADA